ncbi:hypothetical protein FRX31_003296 [Thalictrum thalictroides]|uniref:Uncharacterized protein n=1 Tax=Thalictrum thalictroides TaxID=46969 RepID=A0A7J6XDN2_THATH|nr:hypothetical protein FRX31_003296 [Thalictrum thalictroides]
MNPTILLLDETTNHLEGRAIFCTSQEGELHRTLNRWKDFEMNMFWLGVAGGSLLFNSPFDPTFPEMENWVIISWEFLGSKVQALSSNIHDSLYLSSINIRH